MNQQRTCLRPGAILEMHGNKHLNTRTTWTQLININNTVLSIVKTTICYSKISSVLKHSLLINSRKPHRKTPVMWPRSRQLSRTTVTKSVSSMNRTANEVKVTIITNLRERVNSNSWAWFKQDKTMRITSQKLTAMREATEICSISREVGKMTHSIFQSERVQSRRSSRTTMGLWF